ncbi:unnamed protein product [Trifolium pratense]|nr:unnamed protein product [Trifolium pratense]
MKQNLVGSSNGRASVAQAKKIVEVKGLEIYASMFHSSTMELVIMNTMGNSYPTSTLGSEGKQYDSILAPFDVTLILSVNKSQKLDENAPQYSVIVELSGLVISLDEVQLQQMFLVWDYVCTCRLRERYGRFRPWHCPLPQKYEGWQITWWHYAQEAVLSDVRKKLKKTSWKYFGDRLSYRRKYMNLYKIKLDFLQQEQPVDDDVLQDLERMEKESDLDDILNYRSAAEFEMQEYLSRYSTPNNGRSHTDISAEKSGNDENNVKSRGWLNWLSRGMLGAGGTDDSSQFSGVVSYDVKDISEGTEFHPLVSSSVDVVAKHKLCIFASKIEIHHISASLFNKKHCKAIAEIIFEGGVVESKFYKGHGIIISKFKTGKIVEPNSREVFLQIRRPNVDNNVLDFVDHSCHLQVNFSSNRDMGTSVKGMLQQLQVTFDADILLNLLEFYGFVTSVKSYNKRVLLSLNGIENDTTRLLSKAEYVGVNHERVMWDVSVFDISVIFPWRNTASEWSKMVIKSRSLCFKSKTGPESFLSEIGDQPYFLKNFSNTISTSKDCLGVRLQDLYNYFDVQLNDFKITIVNSGQSQKISILEKFCASFFMAFCLIPDESILKQLEVYVHMESLKVNFSPSIYGAFIELSTHLDSLLLRDESETLNCVYPPNIVPDASSYSTFGISVISRLGSVDLEVDLENGGDNSSVLTVSLQEIDVRFVSAEFQEFFISMKSLLIRAYEVKEEKDSCFVLLSGNLSSSATDPEHSVSGPSIEFDQCSDAAVLADACFAMHYESPRTDLVCHKCFIYLSNADIHCYPHIVGLLVGFSRRLSAYSTSSEKSSASNTIDIPKNSSSFGFQKFGFSNYFEVGSADSACIPFDRFPFVTIYNSGSLGNLESSLIYPIPEWRKYVTLRDRKIISPKYFRVSSSKCKSNFRNFLESGISRISNNFSIELQLYGIRADFHDSSCIIGSIMVPTCKSSVLFCDDSMDILSSSEGLVLTSSWGPNKFQDYLWGPSTANLSPILNVRVRKARNISSTVNLEVCFGIQHVYCMLPSEYLSIIIGYFSLSDWGGGEQFLLHEQGDIVLKSEVYVTYKFEILDCDLFLPVESIEHQFLKVELPQLYGCYIENSNFDDVLKNIPTECLVSIHKLAQRNNCLNIFGRDLNISFLFYANNLLGLARNEGNTEFITSSLIAPLNADVWVRIPRGSESNCKSSSSICVMTGISSCHIIAEDSYFFDGCMAIWDVIEGFSSIGDQSNCFKTDVLQFLHSKKSLKATAATSSTVMPSTIILTEVVCCTQSLMISFCHRHEGFVEAISKVDLQFICSASLVDDSLVWLDLRFSRLVICSSHDSVLATCTSTSSSTFVLSICFSKSIDNMDELSLCLPSLDIWLHLSEWTEIVSFLNHLCLLLEKTPVDAATEHLSVDTSIYIKEAGVKDDSGFLDSESTSMPFTTQETENAVLLVIRSEKICITFNIPIWTSEEPYMELQHAKSRSLTTLSVSSDIVEEKDAEFLTVSVQVNGFELVIGSRDIQLKSNMERLSSVIIFVVNGSHTSLPLLDIIQVQVDAVVSKSDTGNTTFKVELVCDHSDVWLSHPVFYLWGALKFDVPKSESSQYSTGSISFKFQIRKVSVLLTDGKWGYNGPQLEILVRSILFHASASGKHLDCSFTGDLQVNYKNIAKVSWEPFIEPWQFLFTLVRDQEISILPSRSLTTDISLESTTQLNINITESLVECVSRTAEMLDDAFGLMGLKDHKENKLLHPPCAEYICARKCAAPYVIQNLTSVPLLYHVYLGHINPNDIHDSNMNPAKYVQPGSASTIYMDENAEQQLSRYRPYHSSDSLNEQRSSGVAHRYITVQLDGTSMPSDPISMDLVGLTCFDANFSKSHNVNGDDGRMNTAPTFVVPVVLDVSALRYSKLIRIYSTVVLLNATSTPLELRFDIPFGVSPTIFDPIHPGQQFPLPLHLAEAGCVRWRPMGNSYLWSEAHKLSNLLPINSKVGNFKSFICYPSHPNSHPFRCCLSVKSISLTSSGWLKNNLSVDDAKEHYIHHLILSAPLVINNFLPKEILLNSESGGVDHTVRISEVETSIYHIDPSHDLALEICIDGFKCCDFKFPRLETFCSVAKFSETKFSLSETLIFEPNNSNCHIYVTVEKVMDAYSGSRELVIFVPFILYNCMGFPLCVKEASSETDERGCFIPSYYDVGVNETLPYKMDGLSLLASSHDLHTDVSCDPRSYLNSHTISYRKDGNPNSVSFLSNSVFFGNYRGNLGRQERKSNSMFRSSSVGRLKSTLSSRVQSTWNYSGSCNNEHEKVVPCMYSPSSNSSVNDVFVKVSWCFPKDVQKQMPYSLWSNSFSLLPPSGSSTIFVPHLTSNSAFILSVTSISVAEPYIGRTNAITFQPRYVISNACSKEILYKQKGTEVMFSLGIGEHAHLHWTDTSRELLVSICYNETGWQWSGSFLPDHLGDTQLKMRNYVLGTSCMIRVEVQNADISMGDEKIVGNIKGNSGTNLILLSDDDTGYMPYRINNFSKEILRIYQQRCEIFDTHIHCYASNPYTWDEPCYPHRLVVEVPGERVLGLYALDDVKEYMPVYLPSTSEKPERTFFVSVHAEGATKVLSVLDSNYHTFNEVKKSSVPHASEKRLYDHSQVRPADYKEKISISIPYIGISLINSYPQELLFACIKDIQINLLQSLDRQKLSMQISFIQIDNQMRSTPYPVMLSFDSGKSRDDVTRSRIEKSNQMNFCSSSSNPVFCLEISKWKKKDISFLSFEYIKLRMADFRLEIEQEVILSLFEFFTNISSGIQYGIRPSSNQYYGALLKNSSSFVQTSENFRLNADQSPLGFAPVVNEKSKKTAPLPSIIPIGAPWQEIYLLARTQKKIYIELFELAPIKLTLSFSSAPWMLRNRILTSKEFLIHRGLMALADVEGAHIYLKDLTIAHHMASWESIQEILIRHYNRQLLHETYKLFGSAGVIGNPLGFARSMGHGLREFLSVPANNIMQSPTGLIKGMAEGTTSLLSNTLYAVSDAASQFSKVARKGIVAFTYDDQIASRMEKQQASVASDSKGVINEVLEGLTGLLQSPIRGAEKHGLPGVLSGVALGITGLVAKPAASILEVTGKTAQSIRNRSKPNQLRSHRFRVRLPRPLSHEFPLKRYSWDEAVGASVLMEADDGLKFKDEKLVACKALKEAGKFVVLTERYIMSVFSSSLINLGKPEFCGIPADLDWIIEWEIGLESIIHADCAQGVIHIVGSRPDSPFMYNNQHSLKRGSSSRTKPVRWNHYPTHLPLPQTDIELSCEEDAANLLQILLSGIEKGKGRAWDCGRILHRANMK